MNHSNTRPIQLPLRREFWHPRSPWHNVHESDGGRLVIDADPRQLFSPLVGRRIKQLARLTVRHFVVVNEPAFGTDQPLVVAPTDNRDEQLRDGHTLDLRLTTLRFSNEGFVEQWPVIPAIETRLADAVQPQIRFIKPDNPDYPMLLQ